jgi:hypothetical protein
VRGDRVLLETSPLPGAIEEAILIDGHTIVVWWGRAGREACEGSDPRGVTMLEVAVP